MNYTNLGTSGLRVSRICLGMMGFGNGSDRPWVIDEDAADPIVKAAVEGGVTFFDTADAYSAGASEVATGKLVPKYLSRDEAVVATKVFMPVTPGENGGGLGRKHVLSGIDASLRRLEHGLRRPLPDPPLGPPDAHRGDDGGAQRRGAVRQGPLHRSQLHVRVAVRQGSAHRRAQRLGPVRLHAEPLQPHLSRGGARDDPALSRPRRGMYPMESARPGRAGRQPHPRRRSQHDALEYRRLHGLPLCPADRLRRGGRGRRGGQGTRRALGPGGPGLAAAQGRA